MLRRLTPLLCLLLVSCGNSLDSPRCVNNIECGLGVCVAGQCVAADAQGDDGERGQDERVRAVPAHADPPQRDVEVQVAGR